MNETTAVFPTYRKLGDRWMLDFMRHSTEAVDGVFLPPSELHTLMDVATVTHLEEVSPGLTRLYATQGAKLAAHPWDLMRKCYEDCLAKSQADIGLPAVP